MNILEDLLGRSCLQPQRNEPNADTQLDVNLILIPEWDANPSGYAVLATVNGKLMFIGHVVQEPPIGDCDAGWHAIQHRMLHCGVYETSEQAANAVKVGYFG